MRNVLIVGALGATVAGRSVDLSWMRQNAAVGNSKRMRVDQGVTPGTFRYVGSTGASAQQLILGTETTLYVVDKTERNDNFTVGNHPAWAAEIDLTSWTLRPLDIVTNSFCAGGGVTGNGSLVNVGGNNAVTVSGADTNSTFGGINLGDDYKDVAGGKILRTIDPCTNDSCNWVEWADLTVNRWYPSVETLPNGTVAIVGGELYGGYTALADQKQANPTVQVWPGGAQLNFDFLARTGPLNLYPLLWVLPDGLVLAVSGGSTIMWNPQDMGETALPDVPNNTQLLYPASGATAILPLTPANNYTATILGCGGIQIANVDANWDNSKVNVSSYPASSSCYQMKYVGPTSTWKTVDPLPEGRVMGEMVLLPNGQVFMANGVAQGTAGYGWSPVWIQGQQGYGSSPLLMPAIFDPSKPSGSQWSRDGLQPAQFARMYHSTAMLLPDGSVLVAGSNPNADFIGTTEAGVQVNATDTYHTTYAAEKFYPSYYNSPRPNPSGVPQSLAYGGSPISITLPAGSFNSSSALATTQFVVIRTGFATHGVHMSHRSVTLQSSVQAKSDGSATLSVAGVPSPNILPPGPALAFVVISGVPSIGQMVMVGNGQIGTQTVGAVRALPSNSGVIGGDPVASGTGSSRGSSATGSTSSTVKNGGCLSSRSFAFRMVVGCVAIAATLSFSL